jgi:hypothetical protein
MTCSGEQCSLVVYACIVVAAFIILISLLVTIGVKLYVTERLDDMQRWAVQLGSQRIACRIEGPRYRFFRCQGETAGFKRASG